MLLLKVVGLACSGFYAWHSMVVCDGGMCWVWGLNGHGELGVGDMKNRDSPTMIAGLLLLLLLLLLLKEGGKEERKDNQQPTTE